MPSKAEIEARMDLNNKPFKRTLQQSEKGVKNFVGNSIKWIGALAGAAGFAGLTNSAFDYAKRVRELSGLSGTGADEFQRHAAAAKTVRIEMDKLGDIYKDVNDKVGDYMQTGAGPMADFFENIAPKVGVTADMFRELSGPDALQLYYDSLVKANLSHAEITFYMEAIASDAAMLAPLLKDGGEGFKKLGDEAEAAGQIMQGSTVEKLAAASDQVDRFTNLMTILYGEVLVRAIPALKILGNGLGFVGEMLGIGLLQMKNYFTFLAKSIGEVVEPAVMQFKALSKGVEAAAQAAAGNFAEAKAAANDAISLAKSGMESLVGIPERISENFAEATMDSKDNLASLEKSFQERNENILKNWKEMTGGLVKEAEKAGEEIDVALASGGKGGTTGKGGRRGSGSVGDRQRESEEKEKIIKQMRLEALKAEVRGQDELAERYRNRIELAERIFKIQNETNASHEEAVIIANKQLREEMKGKSAAKATAGDPEKDGIQTGSIGDGRRNMPTMRERERAAGLFNTTLGRDGAALDGMARPEAAAAPGAAERAAESKSDSVASIAKEQLTSLRSIEMELTDNAPPKET